MYPLMNDSLDLGMGPLVKDFHGFRSLGSRRLGLSGLCRYTVRLLNFRVVVRSGIEPFMMDSMVGSIRPS